MLFIERPTTVGWTQVKEMRTAAATLKLADMRAGGAGELRKATQAAREAEYLLRLPLRPSSQPKNLGIELATAGAWLLTNVAFMLHDAGDHLSAYRVWTDAEDAAKSANNWSVYCRVRGQRARQHLALGQTDKALEDINAAIEGARDGMLTGTDFAMLWALKARVLGRMGHEQETLEAIGIADTYMYDRPVGWAPEDDSRDRPWIGHYNVGHHLGDTAAALKALHQYDDGGIGYRHAAGAIGLYERALEVAAPGSERTQVLVATSLARLHVSDGDQHRGLDYGHQALEIAEVTEMSSRRVTRRFEELIATLEPYGGPDADALRDRAMQMVAV
jgi:hypothetical protein